MNKLTHAVGIYCGILVACGGPGVPQQPKGMTYEQAAHDAEQRTELNHKRGLCGSYVPIRHGRDGWGVTYVEQDCHIKVEAYDRKIEDPVKARMRRGM